LALGWLSIRLDARYLWQDEAATAVLGQRMIELGQPLGYDGKNLITMDLMGDHEEEVYPSTTVSAQAAVDYYVQRRDFKADTSWTGHPWGQFLIAGIAIESLGRTTFAARFPFVLAGALTVLILVEWMERLHRHRLVTFLAVLFLLGNVYWFAHMRQCRYYALSSLTTLAMVRCYWGWLEGCRWNALGIVGLSALLIHADFGTFFPLMGSLFIHSWFDRSRHPWAILGTFGAVAVINLPWVFFFEMFDRVKKASVSLPLRFLGEVFHINQFMIPLLLVAFIFWRWNDPKNPLSAGVERFLRLSFLFAGILIVWLTLLASFPFHRYVVSLAPLAAMINAWALVEICRSLRIAPLFSLMGAFALLVSPILASPVSAFLPGRLHPANGLGLFVRPELEYLRAELLGTKLVDPNRATMEFLAPRLKPGDEVLINYEDMPAIFYLDQPIRGGAIGFRVGDRTGPPPRFVVIRPSAQFFPYQWKELDRFLRDCRTRPIENSIPDVPWGNCPDPYLNYIAIGQPTKKVLVYECLGWR
jgi:hypothetical protein